MILLLSLLLIFLPADVHGKDILSMIEKKYSKVKGIEGIFVEKHEPGGSSWKGKFCMERGGKLLWIYTDPPGKRILCDGKAMYYFIEREKKVYYRKLKRKPSRFFFVWDKDKLKRYSISAKESGRMIIVTLRPKGEDRDFSWAQLTFNKRTLHLLSISMKDDLGNTTIVIFKKWREKSSFPDKIFKVTIPENFTIQRLD